MFPDVGRPADPPAAPDASAPEELTLEIIYDRHAAMVWRALRSLGVAPDRIDDAVQDVFLVVHRRLASFEARASVTTWLYAIARRVAAGYRRQRESRQVDVPLDPTVPGGESPFEATSRREAAALLTEILGELDDDKREVFALIEVEQLTAPVVAEILGIPLNTVYSRLRLARQRFDAALARRQPPEESR